MDIKVSYELRIVNYDPAKRDIACSVFAENGFENYYGYE
jgi:hypothetical protein